MDYIITDYGAKGNGIADDAKALQAAIDDCFTNGGGRVIVPGPDLFKTGSFILKSNTELHIQEGATLRASDNKADYSGFSELENFDTDLKVPAHINCEYEGKPKQFFIYAADSKNISITGKGKIDGSAEIHHGEIFKEYIEGDSYPRIPMIFFENIKDLDIKDVTLTNSGFWTVHLAGCENVVIDGIKIKNDLKMMNSDGIDPDHCRNVTIKNCDIEAADDCIVFKTTAAYRQYGPCENIKVSDCRLTSTSAAVKFGTESESDFRNIHIDNCTITRTNRGISLMLRDSANIEDVSFSDITIETRRFSKHWWGEGEPIAITAVDRKEGVKAGKIKNIRFKNIECKSENGIFIYGTKENPVEDVSFDNIKIHLTNKSGYTKRDYDIRPCAGNGKVEAKMSGAYLRNARNVEFKNFKVEADEDMKSYLSEIYDIESCEDIVEG